MTAAPPAAVLVVAALAATCTGCFRRAAAPGDAAPPVDYVRRSFQSSLAGCDDAASGAPAACVHLEIEYVDATRATVALAQAVARFVGATVLRPVSPTGPPPNVEALREELYEAYREIQREHPEYRMPWRLKRTVTVACNTERVQGLVAVEQSFTGGAHPTERVVYRSFDTQTGARIGLDALAAPEQRAELVAELERRLRAAPGVAAGQGLWNRTAEVRDDRFVLADDLLVCPDALTVRSSDGAIAAVVPRGDLRGLLRPDAP